MDLCASIEPSDEIQDTGLPRVLVEARLSWGKEDVLAVTHARFRRARNELLVGDLGLDVPSGHEIVIARRASDGKLSLQLPNGTAVPEGYVMTLHVGGATLRLALVADDIVVPLRFRPDARFAFGVMAAASLHIVVMGFLAAGRAPAGSEEENARAAMQGLLAKAEERAAAEIAKIDEAEKAKLEAPAKGDSAARKKDEGSAGNPARTDLDARSKDTRGENRHATYDQKSEGKSVVPNHEEVATFGILALLTGGKPVQGGNSPWATETGPSAMGNIFGTTIHDAAGVGGLGLSGAGDGAGGVADEVKLGSIGTLGHTGGAGVGQGFGCCGGRTTPRREHESRFTIRWDHGSPMIYGRLPPEAIQRIVRQSSGRIRACYTTAVLRDPSVEGRVATKFVIDRSGAVALAANVENTVADPNIASCVTKAFQSMSFPEPEGGIVTVVYPILFTRIEP